jgi:protein tyrosine/serine phosphatase
VSSNSVDNAGRAAPPAPEWSYWVEPGRFLAGCFPGSPNPAHQRQKLEQLLDAGIRVFVNLMEATETDARGRAFTAYADEVAELARARGSEARCLRFPIRDLGIPTISEMTAILDAIDAALETGPVYIHCWGGVGRTGTVVACWLLRHSRATGSDVIQVLARLREMDRERGHRRSPQTEVQFQFVREWATRLGR